MAMPTTVARILSMIACFGLCQPAAGQDHRPLGNTPDSGSVLLSPVAFAPGGQDLKGEEGLLFVPENRASKKAGRTIAVHFFRFPAKKRETKPPVFLLTAGPGGSYTDRSFAGGHLTDALMKELDAYRIERDVVLVNQRGNPNAPGICPPLRWQVRNQPLDEASSREADTRRIRDFVKAGVDQWQERGVDLAGYDILNLTQDVEDLRKSLGYKSICLRGTSFGSQWALAYLKLFPDRVDRMLLSGIEPLNHAYDSPAGIMAALKRLEAKAMADKALVDSLPKELVENGLLESFSRVVKNLDSTPQEVSFPSSNRSDAPRLKVTLGGRDLPPTLLGFLARTRRESVANWPNYIRDVVAGDLRLTAWMEYENRRPRQGSVMIGLLIDNSLGISESRGQKLMLEEKNAWLGDINTAYTASKRMTPTPTVSDEFRTPMKSKVPTLMLHGDVDFSTPLSNAHELLPHLENGHLLTIEGGTHSAFREVSIEQPEIMEQVLAFMNTDFSETPASQYFSTLPKRIDLGIRFRTKSTSLFDD